MQRTRIPLLLICLLTPFLTQAQPLSLSNPAEINLVTDLGIPPTYAGLFKDFTTTESLAYYDSPGPVVITRSNEATIRLKTDNVGQIILFAQLYDTLAAPNTLTGTISIRSFRDGKPMRKIVKVDAEGAGKEKVRYNFEVAGVDSLEIELKSPRYRFVIDKLEIGFLTAREVEAYRRHEADLTSVSSFRKNMSDLLPQTKSSTTQQLDDIQRYYRVLSSIIEAGKYEQLATKKAESYNPFRSTAFTRHYDDLLVYADKYEKRKFEKVRREVNTGSFVNVMGTLDELVTGGKLSSMITLVDGLFDESVNLNFGGQKTTVRRIGNVDYYQTDKGRDKLLLDPITDDEVLSEINRITKTNQDYKTYLQLLARYAREDIKTYNKIEANRRYAEVLKGNLEEAVLSIMDLHSNLPEETFIQPSGVNFRLAGAEVERSFANKIFDPQSFNDLRVRTIETNNLLEGLSLKIQQLTSTIKSDYDMLYETRPTQRTAELMGANLLIDDAIVLEFSNQQRAIKDLYTSRAGLKESLGASVVK